jgi:hypothetical protein
VTDRGLQLQQLMNRMYDNNGRYRTLSALFVDRSPGDTAASLRVFIQQPDVVRTAGYTSVDGAGASYEETAGKGADVTVVSPSSNTETHLRQTQQALPSLSTVPLSVMPLVASYTKIQGIASGKISWLADMFVHPATFITTPFFADKDVRIEGTTTIEGRSAWFLTARTNPLADANSTLGDGWQGWVDQQTGILLRLDYYSGSTLLGSAEVRDLNIDGQGTAGNNLLPNIGVAARAKDVSPRAYGRNSLTASPRG